MYADRKETECLQMRNVVGLRVLLNLQGQRLSSRLCSS